MPRPEITGRKPGQSAKAEGKANAIRAPPRVMSIEEFCLAFRISLDFYFKLQRDGLGPRTMRIGARTLIPIEAVDEWQAEREAEAAREAKATREAKAAEASSLPDRSRKVKQSA
jgi:hypothetical protein